MEIALTFQLVGGQAINFWAINYRDRLVMMTSNRFKIDIFVN